MEEERGQAPGDGRKKSKTRRAWSIYRWYDRLSGWSDWYDWIASFLKTKAGMATAAVSAAAVTTVAVVAVNAPQVQTQPSERQTQGTIIFAIEGKDHAGRRGTFDVVVAKKEFLWVRKSSDELERAGQTISGADIASEVFDGDVRDALGSAREIIAVGTASQEGNAREETERAGRRAQKTAEFVISGIDPKVPIWALNLGQYTDPCETCETGATDWQRPFIVIAVKELEPDTNLGEALTDALANQTSLPSPKSYSAFDLTLVR